MLDLIKRQLNKLGSLVNRFYAFITGRYDEVIRMFEVRLSNLEAVQLAHTKIWRRLETVDGEHQADLMFLRMDVDKNLHAIETIKRHLPEAIILKDMSAEYKEVLESNIALGLEVDRLNKALADLSIEFYKHNKGV